MKFSAGLLKTLNTGFSAIANGALEQATTQYGAVATVVPSSTASNEYGWLGKFPSMREWLGDRVFNQIAAAAYTIKNRDFEGTVEVDRNDIDDDNLGIYNPLFQELGRSAGALPDELVFALLLAGFTTNCYDGQFFFDTDHKVLDKDGNEISVPNTDGGTGTPWFLIDDTRPLKPIIFQERKKPQFVALDNPDNENVFTRKKFLYGYDSRCNVGYGFWQFAWGSKQPLDAAHYAAARAAMMGLKGDYGRPLGIRPTKLVVPPALEGAANKIVKNSLDGNGGTNEWAGTATVEVVPWLA